MRYINTKTGAIIDSPCLISGGDWIEEIKNEVEEDQEVEEVIEDEVVEEVIEEPIDNFDGITIKEIKQELDALGIKYDPKARKQELYDLMLGR